MEGPLKYMEEWLEVQGFEDYWVSDQGRIWNRATDHFPSIRPNQLGIPYVGLRRNGISYNRSIAPIVANAFVSNPYPPPFDTPINLDGDRMNNRVDNLVWRPRWFAVKYHRQFHFEPGGLRTRIQEVVTEEIFDTSWDAATRFGLLDRDILIAIRKDEYVWPTYHIFRAL